MTPLEELQAAHKRLSELRDETLPGPWEVRRLPGAHGIRLSVIESTDLASSIAEYAGPSESDLIVTLHRTIDAQLALLQEAIDYHRSCVPEWDGASLTRGELVLARAINRGSDDAA